ncbi:MAG: hypothetical protein ACHQ4F_14150 [Candidatus Dormibacteria bacterium]
MSTSVAPPWPEFTKWWAFGVCHQAIAFRPLAAARSELAAPTGQQRLAGGAPADIDHCEVGSDQNAADAGIACKALHGSCSHHPVRCSSASVSLRTGAKPMGGKQRSSFAQRIVGSRGAEGD